MKRHFSFGFKALAACAMSAMLAVSCYDDSKLWEEIEGLEERVAALEEKLNTEVATLNSKIGAVETALKTVNAEALAALTEELDALDGTVDGYIKSNDEALKAAIDELKKADAALAAVDTETLAALAKLGVVSVETNASGNVVITFTDKTTLEVPANPESGLVTIVDGHWAVVVDGKTTVLDALVLPDTTLDFRVGDDNTLYVSYDAGKTWESTGIVVDGETLANVVTGVKYNKGDEFVTLVVGQTEYQFPVYEADNSSLVLGRTDAFFMYGASKNINLKAEGITEYYVMSKPDGWKANLDGTVLTVTAPAKELVENGAGELEGEVLIHATTATGTCKVVKLDVTTGAPLVLSYENGNVTLFNALTYTETGEMGDQILSFSEIWFGITPVEDYLEYDSFEEFIKECSEESLGRFSYFANWDDIPYWYVEGEREEQNITMSLARIVEIIGGELDKDETYVLWALPQGTSSYLFEEATYTFTDSYTALKSSNSTYNNVDLSVKLIGADGFYVGALNQTALDPYGMYSDMAPEELLFNYLQYGSYGMGGPWLNFLRGEGTAMGEFYTSGSYNIKLSDVVLPDYMDNRTVDANSKYSVWVLPYYENKSLSEYTLNDLILYSCETASLVKNDALVADLVINSTTYYSVEYTITPPAGGNTKFDVFNASEFNDEFVVEGNLDEKALIMALNYEEPIEEAWTEKSGSLAPETDYVLAAYSTKGGEYCVNIKEFKTGSFADEVANAAAGSTIKVMSSMILSESIVIDKDLTINLNYNEITCDVSDVFVVVDGTLTLIGDNYGFGAVHGSSDNSSSSCAVWAKDNGKVVIKSGTYTVGDDTSAGKTGNWRNDCIYARDNAQITIEGGTFRYTGENPEGHKFLVNVLDDSYKAGTASIVIKGGKFYNFNPANNSAEGVNTNFVAEGYGAAEVSANVFEVVPTPAGKQLSWFDEDYGYTNYVDLGATDAGVLYLGVDYDEMMDVYECPEEYRDEVYKGKIQAQGKYEGFVVTPTSKTAGRITTKYTQVITWPEYEEITYEVLMLYSDYNGSTLKLYSPSQFDGDDENYMGMGVCALEDGWKAIPLTAKVVTEPKEVVCQDNGGIMM